MPPGFITTSPGLEFDNQSDVLSGKSHGFLEAFVLKKKLDDKVLLTLEPVPISVPSDLPAQHVLQVLPIL
jgi:hypothetical protein